MTLIDNAQAALKYLKWKEIEALSRLNVAIGLEPNVGQAELVKQELREIVATTCSPSLSEPVQASTNHPFDVLARLHAQSQGVEHFTMWEALFKPHTMRRQNLPS